MERKFCELLSDIIDMTNVFRRTVFITTTLVWNLCNKSTIIKILKGISKSELMKLSFQISSFHEEWNHIIQLNEKNSIQGKMMFLFLVMKSSGLKMFWKLFRTFNLLEYSKISWGKGNFKKKFDLCVFYDFVK